MIKKDYSINIFCIAILNHKVYKEKKNKCKHKFKILNIEDHFIYGDDPL
jgi:hypothetical protein